MKPRPDVVRALPPSRRTLRGAFAGWLLAAAASVLAGCAGSLPVASAGDAQRAGVDLAELERGRSLVAAKCSSCHRTPLPAEHHTGEWPHMLDEMSSRANLDQAQRAAIQHYLVAMAKR